MRSAYDLQARLAELADKVKSLPGAANKKRRARVNKEIRDVSQKLEEARAKEAEEARKRSEVKPDQSFADIASPKASPTNKESSAGAGLSAFAERARAQSNLMAQQAAAAQDKEDSEIEEERESDISRDDADDSSGSGSGSGSDSDPVVIVERGSLRQLAEEHRSPNKDDDLAEFNRFRGGDDDDSEDEYDEGEYDGGLGTASAQATARAIESNLGRDDEAEDDDEDSEDSEDESQQHLAQMAGRAAAMQQQQQKEQDSDEDSSESNSDDDDYDEEEEMLARQAAQEAMRQRQQQQQQQAAQPAIVELGQEDDEFWDIAPTRGRQRSDGRAPPAPTPLASSSMDGGDEAGRAFVVEDEEFDWDALVDQRNKAGKSRSIEGGALHPVRPQQPEEEKEGNEGEDDEPRIPLGAFKQHPLVFPPWDLEHRMYQSDRRCQTRWKPAFQLYKVAEDFVDKETARQFLFPWQLQQQQQKKARKALKARMRRIHGGAGAAVSDSESSSESEEESEEESKEESEEAVVEQVEVAGAVEEDAGGQEAGDVGGGSSHGDEGSSSGSGEGNESDESGEGDEGEEEEEREAMEALTKGCQGRLVGLIPPKDSREFCFQPFKQLAVGQLVEMRIQTQVPTHLCFRSLPGNQGGCVQEAWLSLKAGSAGWGKEESVASRVLSSDECQAMPTFQPKVQAKAKAEAERTVRPAEALCFSSATLGSLVFECSSAQQRNMWHFLIARQRSQALHLPFPDSLPSSSSSLSSTDAGAGATASPEPTPAASEATTPVAAAAAAGDTSPETDLSDSERREWDADQRGSGSASGSEEAAVAQAVEAANRAGGKQVQVHIKTGRGSPTQRAAVQALAAYDADKATTETHRGSVPVRVVLAGSTASSSSPIPAASSSPPDPSHVTSQPSSAASSSKVTPSRGDMAGAGCKDASSPRGKSNEKTPLLSPRGSSGNPQKQKQQGGDTMAHGAKSKAAVQPVGGAVEEDTDKDCCCIVS